MGVGLAEAVLVAEVVVPVAGEDWEAVLLVEEAS